MLLVALLLVLAGTVSAEVYFYPNDNAVAICNVTTLTCVTNTGWLIWSTSIVKDGRSRTFIISSGLNTVSELGEHITVQLTNKNGSMLTSVATITGSNSTLNGTMISCADTRGTVRSKTLLTPVLIDLGFKPLNFTSATFYWAICGSVNPECVHNYNIMVQSVRTLGTFHNINTVATSLNVTGLTRGEEYTITVSTGHSCKTISMTLEVPKAVTDLMINQLNNGVNVSWKQPQSSRPPVLSYIIQHNITDTSSNLIEWTTYITIHGVLQTGHVYYIQVTPVNALGPGTVGKTILTVTQSLPTTTSVSETTATTELANELWMLLTIVMAILWVLLLVIGGATVVGCCACCAIKRGRYMIKLKYAFEGPPELDTVVQLHLNATEDCSGEGGEGVGGGQTKTSVEKTGPPIYDQPVNFREANIPMKENISYATGAI